MAAATKGFVATVRRLLQAGAQTGLVNRKGFTAEGCAEAKAHKEVVRAIREHVDELLKPPPKRLSLDHVFADSEDGSDREAPAVAAPHRPAPRMVAKQQTMGRLSVQATAGTGSMKFAKLAQAHGADETSWSANRSTRPSKEGDE